MSVPASGLTTGITYPNVPAPERAEPEYADAVIADNAPRTGYVPVPGMQPKGDNNPEGQVPGMPVSAV